MSRKLIISSILILLVVLFLFGKEKTDKNINQKEIVSLEEIVTIKDDDDAFYGSIDTFVSKDGKVVILDRGNHRAIVYNLKGEKILEFSKEGNGPGEFSSTQFDPVATEKYLLFESSQKIMVYNYNAELISEIPGDFYYKIVNVPKENYMQFYYMPGKGAKYLSAKYSYSGEFISGVERGHDDRESFDRTTWEGYLDNYELIYKEQLGFTPFGGKFLRIDQMEYNIRVCNLQGEVEKTIKRDFKRVKMTEKDMITLTDERKRSMSKKEIEETMKNYNRLNSMRLKISGGYVRDIKRIVSRMNNDYAFFWLASEDENEILLDIYDTNFDFVSQLRLFEKGLNWAKVVNGKLICEYKNEEDGFYFKIFNLKINADRIEARKQFTVSSSEL